MVKDYQEWTARIALLLVLIGLPLMIFGFQLVLRPSLSDTRIVDIHMLMPEVGGFSQDAIQVNTGETVTLRFHADDVTHGIAIGPGLDVDLGAIDPGEVGEVSLTFDQPGTYTYYCTTYCSPNHWRMRGVIQVRDSYNPELFLTAQPDPVIANLQVEGVNIDEPRIRFQPVWGLDLAPPQNLEDWVIPEQITEVDWQHTHTPVEASVILVEANPDQSTESIYAVVTSLWLANPTNSDIDGQYLYNQNCASCHGESGLSDGIGAFFTPIQPAAFGNESYMFTMRSDVLYAKIRRGGMGTDMPNFGTILTREETWALVDYLWQLALTEQ